MVTKGFGSYRGRIVAEFLDDGRKMKLTEDFTYLDPNGDEWIAPAGSIIDGASIPRFAWTIIGGPFEKKYRNASVIHDVACVDRKRRWEDTHRVFYTGMLASDVEYVTAKIMYAAVYHFGPRWPFVVVSREKVGGSSRVGRIPGMEDGFSSGTVDNEPEYRDVEHVVEPKSKTLNEGEFQKLKNLIEVREKTDKPMGLSEIATYR